MNNTGTLSAHACAKPPKAFSEPGPPWQAKTPYLPSRRHEARVTVRGHDPAAFLPENDRANAFLGDRFDDGFGREAGEPLESFLLKNLRNSFVAVHVSTSLSKEQVSIGWSRHLADTLQFPKCKLDWADM